MHSLRNIFINKYLHIIRWFIPADIKKDARSTVIAQNFVTLTFLAVTAVPFFSLLYHSLNFDKAGMIVLIGGGAMLCAPFLLKYSGRILLAREAFIFSFFCLKLCLAFYLGGIESPTLPWLLLCPIMAIVLGGVRSGAIWGAIITTTVFGVFYLQTHGVAFPPAPINDQRLLHLASILGLFVFSAILLLFFRHGDRNDAVSWEAWCGTVPTFPN